MQLLSEVWLNNTPTPHSIWFGGRCNLSIKLQQPQTPKYLWTLLLSSSIKLKQTDLKNYIYSVSPSSTDWFILPHFRSLLSIATCSFVFLRLQQFRLLFGTVKSHFGSSPWLPFPTIPPCIDGVNSWLIPSLHFCCQNDQPVDKWQRWSIQVLSFGAKDPRVLLYHSTLPHDVRLTLSCGIKWQQDSQALSLWSCSFSQIPTLTIQQGWG